MDYSRLLQRAFELVTRYPFLILMGVLASLSGGIGGGGNSTNFRFGRDDAGFQQPQIPDFGQIQPPDIDFSPALGVAAALLPVILCFALIIGIILWAIGTIARGGLVAAVDAIESGVSTTFGGAWQAGWNRAGRLLGISLIPAIPGLILFVAGLGTFITTGGMAAIFGENVGMPFGAGALSIIGLLACIAVPFALILGLLRTFAERACMIEGLGVVDSYRRGFEVLTANLGAAIVLFVIQILISIVIGVLLFLPGLVAALCFLLWPLLWLFNGVMAAYFSSLWTLAWRTWTGATPVPVEGTV
jgi:hypothetical protein